MRIVAGTLGGRVIAAPDGEGTRPTTDRVREALFSSLYSLRGGFEGAVVLDAFAGSGALGIEALSRGSDFALFLERDQKAAKVLEDNVRSCGLVSQQAVVMRCDALTAFPRTFGRQFDLVFLDPPYAYDAVNVLKLVENLAQGGLLAADAIVVYEHGLKEADAVSSALETAGCEVRPSKKYGKTGVTIGVMRTVAG